MEPVYDLFYLTADAAGQRIWMSMRSRAVIALADDVHALLYALDQLDALGWEVVTVGDVSGDHEHEILVRRKG